MSFKDVTGCIGATMLLLFASAWIPFIGPFFGLLTPIPFLYYAMKLGRYHGLKVFALTLLIVGLIGKLTGYPQIVFFCLEFGLVGLIISEIYRRKLSFGLTIFWGTLFALTVSAIFLSLIALSEKMGPFEMVLEYFRTNLKTTIGLYENAGLDPEKVLQLREYGRAVTEMIAKVYPSLMIICTGLVVWIVVVLSKPLFRLRNLEYPDFGNMDQWEAPEMMVWGLIASGFALFFPMAGIRFLAINGLIVMLVIYAFGGLSIGLFFLNKYNVPPWIRFGVYFLIIIQQIVWLGLAMVGLFDQWVDFRKIHKRAVS
jgi:uncharacterized protein YybS (DUF2232 family)